MLFCENILNSNFLRIVIYKCKKLHLVHMSLFQKHKKRKNFCVLIEKVDFGTKGNQTKANASRTWMPSFSEKRSSTFLRVMSGVIHFGMAEQTMKHLFVTTKQMVIW